MTHSSGQILRSTFWYTGAVVGQKVLSFVYFFLLSSQLSPDVLGLYVWMLSIVSLAGIGTDVGMLQMLTRELAQHEERARALSRMAVGIKVPLLGCTLAVVWFFFWWTSTDVAAYGSHRFADLVPLLFPASFLLAADTLAMVYYGLFRSRQMVSVESRGIILFQSVVFLGGLTALWLAPRPSVFLWVMVSASAVNVLYLTLMCYRIFGWVPWPDFHLARARELIGRLPSFTLANIFQKVYNTADSILLGFLATPYETGIYAVPAKVTTALQTLIPGAFATAIYPSLSHYAKHAQDRVRGLFTISFSYVLLLVLPIALALFVMADSILQILFSEYTAAADAFRIMVVALPAVFLTYPTGTLLNAIGAERRATAHRGVMTGLNIGMNLLLIPILGVRGAALAFLASNITLLTLDVMRVLRFDAQIFMGIWSKGIRMVGAALCMAGTLLVLVPALAPRLPGSLFLLCLVMVGAGVYAGVLWLFGVISMSEFRHAYALMRNRTPSV